MACEKDVYANIQNHTRYVNNPAFPPHGAINYNTAVFSGEKLEDLAELRSKVKKENEKYLYDHPEIGALVSCFLHEVFTTKPPDAGEFLAKFFSRKDLRGMVKDTVHNTYEIHNRVKHIPKNTVDGGVDKLGSKNAYVDTIHPENILNKRPPPCTAEKFVPE